MLIKLQSSKHYGTGAKKTQRSMGQNGEPIINQLTFDERGEIIQRRRDP